MYSAELEIGVAVQLLAFITIAFKQTGRACVMFILAMLAVWALAFSLNTHFSGLSHLTWLAPLLWLVACLRKA